jgi:hypothetical protein
MKILFDNGTPNPIAGCLAGHEVTYARRIGWHELENGELIQRAEEAGYDVLLSTGKNTSRTYRAGRLDWSFPAIRNGRSCGCISTELPPL